MPTTSSKRPARPVARVSRTDGSATRQHLLETAGQVFADRGFAGATSKAICERAGTPLASVNYHFGSREALYEAVLIEAHGQLVALDDLLAMTRALPDARAKVRAVVGHLAGIANRGDTPWGFRVMLREVMTPSAAMPALAEKAVRPKAALVLGLVGELMQLPPGHPAVQRGVMFTILPCIAMMLAPRQLTGVVLPEAVRDTAGLVADFVDYTLAGLDALAAAHRATPATAGKPPARKPRSTR
jgi:AcrR family transcriptional regulator